MMTGDRSVETSANVMDIHCGPRPNSPDILNSFDNFSGRESFRFMINRLYGEEAVALYKRLERLRKKKGRLLSALAFLLRCRDAGTVPMFLRQKRYFNSAQAHRILDRTERALLRERIHNVRRELAVNDAELYAVHQRTSGLLSPEHWGVVDRMTFGSLESCLNIAKKRQMSKFERCNVNNRDTNTALKMTVINLSERQLSADEISVLAKGEKFAVAPRRLPVEDIISNIEAGIRSLPPADADEIRMESARILKRAKPLKSNITAGESRALRGLRSDEEIVILPADKGSATVVLNTSDYRDKIQDVLDPNIYRKLPKDPTGAVVRKTEKLVKQSSLAREVKIAVRCSEALPPRLYGLPKIHKEGVPLRPIVSAIGSPTYALAKHLASLLQPHIGLTEAHVRDSAHFVGKLKEITLGPNDVLISFDVVSLFTMVPLRETLEFIGGLFTPDITALFRQVLTTTYFQYDGSFYEQLDGVAMGSPLSPVVANFYMERFEELALTSAPCKPKCWFRYVDDTFVVWNHGETELVAFLEHLNGVHSNIRFTMERENDNKLPFLDVLVLKRADGSLGHTVYRKATHTDRYLHHDSNHHPRQKRALMKTLVDRALRICEPQLVDGELKHLEKALQANGYSAAYVRRARRPRRPGRGDELAEQQVLGRAFLPYVRRVTDRIGKLLERRGVRPVFLPTKKIQQCLRSVKDARDPLSLPGVYRVPCSCGKVYVGSTKRSVKTRVAEHRRHCRLDQPEKSAVAEHALENDDHSILFGDVEILSTERRYFARLAREAIEIWKHGGSTINRRAELMSVNKYWFPALRNTGAGAGN